MRQELGQISLATPIMGQRAATCDFTQLSSLQERTLPNPLITLSCFANRWLTMRHGYAGSNEDRILISSPKSDDPKYGLLPTGRSDIANKAISNLKSLLNGTSVLVLITSELLRTIETGDEVEKAKDFLGLTQIVRLKDARLNDRFYGAQEGCSVAIWESFKEHDLKDPFSAPYGGECVASMGDRIGEFMLETDARFRNATILTLTHCDIIQMMGALCSKSLCASAAHYSKHPYFEHGEVSEVVISGTNPFPNRLT